MPRAEVIVSNVRQCLERAELAMPADAADVAREFVTAVETVNIRLERCVRLLRRGLRSEAVHEAEIAPPVLDEAAALDLPQADQWRELCVANNLPVAPAVNRDAVVELDEAFPGEQQVKRLLDSHRRLALAQAPLKARIKVLRKLSRRDEGLSIWGEDLATFEVARHKQIAAEVARAQSRGDTAALQALDVECGEIWLEKPPASLQQNVKRALAELRVRDARGRLGEITARIAKARQAESHDELAELIKTWGKTRVQAQMQDAPESDSVVAEARNWLAEQADAWQREDEHASAVRAVEHALDEQHPIDRIERKWAQLVNLERPIPRVLQQRYEARLREAHVLASRRFKLRASLVAACILLVAGVVAGLIYWGIVTSERQTWDRQITNAMNDGRLSEAQSLLRQLQNSNAALWQQPSFQSLQEQVDSAVERENQRQQRFDAAISAAEQADVRTPDRDAIRLAEQLATSEADKSRLDAVQQRIRQYASQSQMKRDEELSVSLSKLRTRFLELRKQVDESGAASLPALQDLQRALATTLSGHDATNPTVVSAQLLTSELATLIAQLERDKRQSEAAQESLAAIRQLHSQPGKLIEAMRGFRTQFQDHPWSADLQAASLFAAVDIEVAAWRDAFPQLAHVDPARDKASADAIAQRLTKFLEEHPQSPYQSVASAYIEYLKRASLALDRNAGRNSPNANLMRLLNSSLVAGVYVLSDVNGNRFYSRSDDEPKPWGEGRVLVSYISSFEEALGERNLKSREFTREQFDADDIKPKLSAQSIFGLEAEKLSRTVSWQTRHLALLDLLEKENAIDPILKLMMAKELVRLSRLYDAQDSSGLAVWAKQAEQVVGDTPWMDPSTAGVKAARVEAQQQLDKLPSPAELITQVSSGVQDLHRAIAPRQAVALLWQENDGRRCLSVAPLPFVNGVLEAIQPDSAGWKFVKVGSVDGGQVTLDDIANQLPLGTLVYTALRNE